MKKDNLDPQVNEFGNMAGMDDELTEDQEALRDAQRKQPAPVKQDGVEDPLAEKMKEIMKDHPDPSLPRWARRKFYHNHKRKDKIIQKYESDNKIKKVENKRKEDRKKRKERRRLKKYPEPLTESKSKSSFGVNDESRSETDQED